MSLQRLFPDKPRAEGQNGLAEEIFVTFLAYSCLMVFPSLASVLFTPFLPLLASVFSLFFTAVAFVPIFVFLRFAARDKSRALYISKSTLRPSYLLFYPISALFLLLLVFVLCLFGAYAYVGMRADAFLYLPLLFLGYLVQGSAEELLCRGFLMSSLSARFGGVISAGVSALFFSLMHIFNPALSVLGLLNIFLFGLFFASLTQKTGSILPACLFHAGWNFLLSLIGVQISGTAPVHSLLILESKKDFLTGGSFGPEASPILCVLLLILLCASCFENARSKK